MLREKAFLFISQVDEFLHSLSMLDFCRIDITSGIHGYVMDPVELSGITTAAAEMVNNSQILPVQYPYALGCAIGTIEERLLRIVRKINIHYGPIASRIPGDKCFFHKLTILMKNLDPIVDPVAFVNKTLVG